MFRAARGREPKITPRTVGRDPKGDLTFQGSGPRDARCACHPPRGERSAPVREPGATERGSLRREFTSRSEGDLPRGVFVAAPLLH